MFPATAVHRGDVLTLVGPTRRIAEAVSRIGVPDRATDVTDMVLVAFGIVAGALDRHSRAHAGRNRDRVEPERRRPARRPGVRLAALDVAALLRPHPRSDAVGVRVDRARRIRRRRRPQRRAGLRDRPAHERRHAWSSPGLLTVLVPHLVGVVVGRWVFKMQPGVLLGVCAGAGTATPALAAIQEAAKSAVPTLGYGVVLRGRQRAPRPLGHRHRRAAVSRSTMH